MALCLECVCAFVNEVGHKDPANHDHCGIQELSTCNYLIRGFLGVICNPHEYWQNHSKLQVLIENYPVSQKDKQERKLIAQQVKHLLPNVPILSNSCIPHISYREENNKAHTSHDDQACRQDKTSAPLILEDQFVEDEASIDKLEGIHCD